MSPFTPFSASDLATVDRFNGRMNDGVFPTGPCYFDDPTRSTGLSVERYVALDGGGEMRAGYRLKHQLFKVGGGLRDIATLQSPMSEGLMDKAYAALGTHIVKDALRKAPLAFALGLGGPAQPYARLLAALRWKTVPVPFYLKILRPYRFFRGIRFLRERRGLRLALDLLAFSGLGALAVRGHGLLAGRPRPRPEVAEVEAFTPWADDVWARASEAYPFTALRSAAVLDFIYRDRKFIRYRVGGAGREVGWAVCLATPFTDHLQFGALKVGTLVDCLAVPGQEAAVVAAAEANLRDEGVDLVVTNQTHRAWGRALGRAGFLRGPSNFLLACSPGLAGHLEAAGIALDQAHVNRGDGDGPIHL